MNPARKKRNGRGRDATEANQRKMTALFCGKLWACPASRQGEVWKAGLIQLFQALHSQVRARLRCCRGVRSWKNRVENKRPDRGDNRSGQAIWALGVDGRSRLIQLWGGITAPTPIGRRGDAPRSRRRSIFLTVRQGVLTRKLIARLRQPAAPVNDPPAYATAFPALLSRPTLRPVSPAYRVPRQPQRMHPPRRRRTDHHDLVNPGHARCASKWRASRSASAPDRAQATTPPRR